MSKVIDISGQRFNSLTVISRSPENNNKGNAMWICLCDCGKETVIVGSEIRNGHTQSCGCLRVKKSTERLRKHGHTFGGVTTSEYKAWSHLISRCTNKNTKDYKDYGGRGILVCDRWRYNFSAFLEDMGEKPTPQHSIDRIDVNGNYDPSNCRWATAKEQANNQRVRTSASGISGVNWCNTRKRWIPKIFIDGKQKYIGRFLTLEDAINARNESIIKYNLKSS